MQIHFLSALLFGVSSNMDNLVVGLSYGIKKVSIRWLANLIVALITFTGTVLSMALGKSVLLFLPESFAGMLGGIIIILIGLVGLGRYFLNHKALSEEEGEMEICPMTAQEAALLGCALTLNNIALGVGASITGLSLLPTAGCSFMCSLLFLHIGNKVGHSRVSDFVGRFAEPLAHLLMIGLGAYEIFI